MSVSLAGERYCQNCSFWDEKLDMVVDGQCIEGKCRRHHPTVMANPLYGESYEPHLIAVWPETGNEDWCGDWCGDLHAHKPVKESAR